MNDWLKRRNQRTYKELDGIIKEWQTTGNGDNRIYEFLSNLADTLLMVMGKKSFPHLHTPEVKKELVDYAMSKLNRLDTSKGKAFNFFTTVMLGHLRQLYRSNKNYTELKEQWRKRAKDPSISR